MSQGKDKLTFVLHWGKKDIDEYSRFAKLATRLKELGRVQVNISGLSDKSFHEIPEGGSPWHEYASYNSALFKFFPHPAIAPHIPANWVKENRELLLAKAAVLREFDLEAAFWGYEGAFLPESFFCEHPHLRGPRIDHPRRTIREEFAMCLDLVEAQDMTAWMMAELKRHVPEVNTYCFRTNDAGGGICWAAPQYAGPNGPRHCQGLNSGERLRNLIETLWRGAREGGGEVSVHIDHSNFWTEEAIIRTGVPEGAWFYDNNPAVCRIATAFYAYYPIRYLVDLSALIETAEKLYDSRTRVVVMDFRAMYQRDIQPLEVVERVIDIVKATWAAAPKGRRQRLTLMRDICASWAGEEKADALVDAFCDMHEALTLKNAVAQELDCHHVGVSMRYITRPLVFKPDELEPDEMSYFLPHVFNPYPTEAIDDYADLHGSRVDFGRSDSLSLPAVKQAIRTAQLAAANIENLASGAPEETWLRKIACSFRIWASIMRSCHNFYFAQVIRDRKREALMEEPRLPSKLETWTGDPDLLAWHELMRDELDNTQELLGLLERGGGDVIARAKDARHEDTFVLGPDLEDQLRKKAFLMRKYWMTGSRYLATPHK